MEFPTSARLSPRSKQDLKMAIGLLLMLSTITLLANAWTDVTCFVNFGVSLPYACNWGSACACGSTLITAGPGNCCVHKPPGCEGNALDVYNNCGLNALCYGPWANFGSCTGCGAGEQKQVKPCNGRTGSAQTRTIFVTCG